MNFTSQITHFFSKDKDDKSKINYIFYKLIDSKYIDDKVYYQIQCTNKKAFFFANLEEIVEDTSLLYHFHPSQACYLGLQFSNQQYPHYSKKEAFRLLSRYGRYKLKYQTRDGGFCFTHRVTQADCLMDSRNLALSDELIKEFDASQAFYIGWSAGIKIRKDTPAKPKKLHLKIVK